MSNVKLYNGDCLEVMKTLEENSVDAIITDPPYELGFMGKKWDNTGVAYNVDIWRECLRVLKPGGHLLSFGGTRTYHRMAVAIEDAGFEVRDMIEWVYGSGFPKSHNIGKAVDKLQGNEREVVEKIYADGTMPRKTSKYVLAGENLSKTIGSNNIETKGTSEWEGWGTALKPAHEPICLARKPLAEKTVAENCLKYGTGGINIDESRVDYQSEADKVSATPQGKCTSNTSAGSAPDVDMSEVDYNGEKYWYKNEYKWLIDKWLNDEDYVWSELKENLETYNWCKVPDIDSGDRVLFDSQEGVCVRLYESKRKEFERPDQLGRFPANLIHDNSEEVRECFPETKSGNSGNASRFFKSIIYQAKASKKDRGSGNNHPTVKPIKLTEYLINMVSTKDSVILDPFMGSGTTGVACKNLNRSFIGIELDEEYFKIAEDRINNKGENNE